MKTLTHPLLAGSPYRGYTYGYPHKTAYRPFGQPLPLEELWRTESRNALFFYVHVPFCEMRCAFCNLFTQVRPKHDVPSLYLDALGRQVEQVRRSLGTATFARLAIGGGTPTYLSAPELNRLFDLIESMCGGKVDFPASVETSPETATGEALQVLRARGVTRVSIGVQSFLAEETASVGRPQQPSTVHHALLRLRDSGFPSINIDLMYGLPGQSPSTWLISLEGALRYRPEEVFLYPLYIRPLTGLGRSRRTWDDDRLALYRQGRDFLIEAGYRQYSMRMFRAAHAAADVGPVYCCQTDGMVGLGCGARSYTQAVHYSLPYGVRGAAVREIIAAYTQEPSDNFRVARHGFILNGEEQRRRFIVQSLLQADGLSWVVYRRRFGTDLLTDYPELRELEMLGLALATSDTLTLTAAGLERSDVIGPWLYSSNVRERMEMHRWR
jgi:oxygen-independent coproporphyrinogen-3 oxidase